MSLKLTDKSILIVSPEPWSHIFVSKHHYAVYLATRNNKVYFLNPPSSNYEIGETPYPNLKTISYRGFVPKLRSLPKATRKFFVKRVYNKLSKLCGCQFDIIWSFDNSVFFDLDLLPNDVYKISHIVDLNQDFEFDRAARSADICFATTSYILERQLKQNKNSHFVNHGFDNVKKSKEQLKLDFLRKDNSYSIGYTGNLDIPYLDWKLLRTTIDNLKKETFYFAGPCKDIELVNWLNSQPNVSYIGSIEPKLLASFYDQMDILIVCYKADEYKEQLANPHKMMSYLASGNPIVTTFTEEYAKYDNLIAMSDKNEKWSILLDEVIINFDSFNRKENRDGRLKIALENTYSKQIEKIESLINSEIDPI